MIEPNFRSDVVVKPVRVWGSDRDVARSALAADPDAPDLSPAKVESVLRAMLARKVVHTSPFEHVGLSVYADAPAVVWWEWTRHRFQPQAREDHSFNLESGRYKILRPDFYVPPSDRPVREPDGFKPMRPNHERDPGLTELVHVEQAAVHRVAWASYQRQLAAGVAREVARNVLGPAIYYAGHVSGGLLSWLHFLALRTRDDPANPSSYPQWEIERAALACEALIAESFPVTHRVFVEKGRCV